ncbi:hypothetical protein [Microbacterium arborescens]|uniref:hypothetical protein n=1 Tax=Microbacterium arborescens TaxID=33883 RepID=UPI0025A1C461|nr:hypothetical protein [Microbacterium arborescens]WJM16947.1 hypothetical protein QUC20_06470 [Microbacterium arborescens]
MNALPVVDLPGPLRHVSPPEAPYPGEILASRSGTSYRVAASSVPQELWSAVPGGHLLAPDDVDRVADATVVILPLVSARLCGGSTSFDLTPGQAVTLAVSVLRGAVDAARSEWREGEWWSTSDGRPVLVPTGTRAWDVSSRIVLDRIPDAAIARALRDRVVEALADRVTLPFAAPTLEDDLFGLATPEPFVPGAPGPARPLPSRPSEDDSPSASIVTTAASGLVDGDVMKRVMAAAAGVRAEIRRAAGGLVRRWGRPATGAARLAGRRRVMWVALGAVAATLVVGFSLPHDADADARARTVSHERRTEEPSARPQGFALDEATIPATGAETRPAEPAARIIDELADCWRADEPTCRASLLERADAALPDGIATADAPREVRVLDDLGGVEVVRVDDPSGRRPAQVVVVVAHDEKRLVRDVYDVADQP